MYNVMQCNARQLKDVLKLNYELEIPTLIVGPPGIGKTDIVRQFAREVGLKMPDRPIILSGYQPEDLLGVPMPNKETGYLDYFLMKVFPASHSEERWLLFFDEFTNCDKRLQAPLQQFFLYKELGDYKAPKHTYLVAAGNSVDDGCFAYELSRALEDRFCIVSLQIDVDSWMDWALENQIHPSIISFIKTKPEFLHYSLTQGKHYAEEDRVLPTPRAWGRFVDRYLKSSSSRTTKEICISGVVGAQVASMFFRVVDELETIPSPKEVIEAAKKKAQLKDFVPPTAVGLWSLAFSLLAYCQELAHYEGLVKYLEYLTTLERTNLPVREVISLTTERALQDCRKKRFDRKKVVELFRNLALRWKNDLSDILRELQ